MKLAPLICVIGLLLAQGSCTTGPGPGNVVSEKIVRFDGKRFLQQRIVLTSDPYETELRTVQLR